MIRIFDSVTLTRFSLKYDYLLRWLYDLPNDFGFNINNDVVEFNVVDIEASIDNLISSFSEMEEKKEGKLD